MKLPEEVKKVERSLHADEEEKLYEAIVRDCAKVCLDAGPKDGALTLVSVAFAKAILARYGLEPK